MSGGRMVRWSGGRMDLQRNLLPFVINGLMAGHRSQSFRVSKFPRWELLPFSRVIAQNGRTSPLHPATYTYARPVAKFCNWYQNRINTQLSCVCVCVCVCVCACVCVCVCVCVFVYCSEKRNGILLSSNSMKVTRFVSIHTTFNTVKHNTQPILMSYNTHSFHTRNLTAQSVAGSANLHWLSG